MPKIDRETVQRILDAADIVEVVSDFVHLKRRGSSYIGLCPFHNERTPSFSVSRAKGICKCFSCGKGGSPVNFIMEHEQLSYNEALRYLARKYHIEIQEHEMTEQERQEATERESLFAVNEFALQHFEHNLTETDDGRGIGLAYFQERGINDISVKRFRLGYSPEQRDDLLKAARAKGYQDKYLILSGLCIQREDGEIYDRFKGRVIYPIFSVSGKVIAFGARILRSSKIAAKYVNSPESAIYRKSRELYGLYQAKQAIVKKDKCILVEGYMDVISMHQSGVENVVASSGTSLTEGQIRLIHRFTDNVTVIYDSDAAGIKASLRGIDMLLSEGMNVKVLLLPEGEDPDSFAQSHSSSELEEYLSGHETDFIKFKTSILLQGIKDDPIQRSKAISDIVRSISVIPDDITRAVYIKECSRTLDIGEKVLTLNVAKARAERAESEKFKPQRNSAAQSLEQERQGNEQEERTQATAEAEAEPQAPADENAAFLAPYERELLRYVLKYGMVNMAVDDKGEKKNVIEYVRLELESQRIGFSNPAYALTFREALKAASATWQADYDRQRAILQRKRLQELREGEEEIGSIARDLDDIKRREQQLAKKCEDDYKKRLTDFCSLYLERILVSSPDDVVRQITTELVSKEYVLSKVHSKYSKIETELERLDSLVERALYELENAILCCRRRALQEKIKEASSAPDPDMTEIRRLMTQKIEYDKLEAKFAKRLGERIVPPRR